MSSPQRRVPIALPFIALGLGWALCACDGDYRIESEVQQVQDALKNDQTMRAAADALPRAPIRADDKKAFTALIDAEVRELDRTITGVGARVEHDVARVSWLDDRMMAVREARAYLDQQRSELKVADEHNWEQQAADVESAIVLLEQRLAELEAVLNPGAGAAI